jgi:hypothetical protein
MTTRPTPRVLALAAAVTSLLLLAPLHQAEARGGGARTAFGSVTTGTVKLTAAPVVRDHREVLRWSDRCHGFHCWKPR